ncbi:MAG: pyridoxamine 5'-phosphate oxidase [Alphaproteobacteria bacterium]|nr:pyridoxamine 5'-phosphate oxidase [Alphaproteobacteria bacterium]
MTNVISDSELRLPETPLDIFHIWISDAKISEPSDPDAACLATVDANGYPNARVVLIRKIDDRGFCFFTNTESQKGHELATTERAAINFHWKSLKRQVRIRGDIERVSDIESDIYYTSRPLGNRIGAWASMQSQPLENRQILIDRVAEMEKKWGETPPRPAHWGGYRLVPHSIEFWQEEEHRLHRRIRYDRNHTGVWTWSILYP